VIRVCIADDHDLIRDGFARLLAGEEDMELAGSAASVAELEELLKRCRCDVLVLDLALPDMHGLEVLPELSVSYPRMRVLVLSMYPEERYAVRVIKSGGAGYISKTAESRELIRAVRRVSGGSHYVSESLAAHLASGERGDDTAAHEGLSNREFEILLLIGRGKSAAESAAELGLSVNTVNTYRRRLMEKMGLRCNADIVRYVLRHRLID
jgi:DNA-binding NarL/FixJ family response regulator